jgi:formylglycine-generating enzyme required for sulfatase activity
MNSNSLHRCFAVRLVHDTIVPQTIPDPCLVVKVNDTLSINMMCVEGGTFMMGSDAPDAEANEKPLHEVTLSDYYIGQTEVTQHLWKKVMGSDNNPSAKKGDNLPVTNISWDNAQQFVTKLSEMTGLHFRLPTEAEWEYAARGGQRSQGYTYAGSNDLDSVAWYPSNCQKPQAVGKKKPNELGIYDMSGNVYDWCYDWYGPYPSEPQTDPQGPTTSSIGYRIARGGCWQAQDQGDDASYCRIANRGYAKFAIERIGLRIVLEIEK